MTPSRNGCCRFPRDSDTMLPIWNSDNQLDVSGSGVADFSLGLPPKCPVGSNGVNRTNQRSWPLGHTALDDRVRKSFPEDLMLPADSPRE